MNEQAHELHQAIHRVRALLTRLATLGPNVELRRELHELEVLIAHLTDEAQEQAVRRRIPVTWTPVKPLLSTDVESSRVERLDVAGRPIGEAAHEKSLSGTWARQARDRAAYALPAPRNGPRPWKFRAS